MEEQAEREQRAPGLEASHSAAPTRGWQIVALVIALGITVLILLYRDQLAQLGSYGYAGLFVVSLVGNATVLLPVPSLAATFVAGRVFDPLLAGIVSGAGMALGELSGYLAGYGGMAMVEKGNTETLKRLESWMRHNGFLTIFALAAIPNPVFDLAGIAAGVLRFPFWRFLLACFLGKTAKGVAFALVGAHSLQWLDGILQ